MIYCLEIMRNEWIVIFSCGWRCIINVRGYGNLFLLYCVFFELLLGFFEDFVFVEDGK